MICPECQKEGQQSTVTGGFGTTTLLAIYPFWDEDGRYHIHDCNTSRRRYTCSRGHEWTEVERGSCWCGWRSGE